jgi:hypothetical protein
LECRDHAEVPEAGSPVGRVMLRFVKTIGSNCGIALIG